MPFGYGIGIAVEGKDLRTMVHHRRAIAARAEGAIDMTLARGNGERGQHFIKEAGNMRCGGGHLAPPRLGFLGFFSHSRSEEHTSELQSLMRTSYAVYCLKK